MRERHCTFHVCIREFHCLWKSVSICNSKITMTTLYTYSNVNTNTLLCLQALEDTHRDRSHRDLKSGNVMVSDWDGKAPLRVHLVDWANSRLHTEGTHLQSVSCGADYVASSPSFTCCICRWDVQCQFCWCNIATTHAWHQCYLCVEFCPTVCVCVMTGSHNAFACNKL